jgi:hypothetical protein
VNGSGTRKTPTWVGKNSILASPNRVFSLFRVRFLAVNLRIATERLPFSM